MSGLEVRLLGPIEVRHGGVAITVPGAKQRAVIAALALDPGRVVPIGTLLDAVWGDPPPDRAEHSLQQHVSALRKVLADGDVQPLVTRSPGYVLDVAHVDVGEFGTATKQGHRLVADGRDRDAADAFERALACWRGPALADARDSLRLAAAAVRLDEQRLGVTEARNDVLLALGRSQEVVDEVRRQIHEHPRRERLWAQLMLALYRTGRQADALAAYGEARHALVDELGLEPGQELRELEQAILEQRPTLDLPADRAQPAEEPHRSVPAGDDIFATFTADARPDLGRLRLPDGQLVVLPRGPSLLGRDPSALVRLVDNRVSRTHARIDADHDGCVLHDLDSSNGTFVAGARISEHRLHDGDIISLGGVELSFHGPA